MGLVYMIKEIAEEDNGIRICAHVRCTVDAHEVANGNTFAFAFSNLRPLPTQMSRRSYIAKEQKQKGGGDIARAFLREESHHVSYHRHLLTTSTIDSRTHNVTDTLDAPC